MTDRDEPPPPPPAPPRRRSRARLIAAGVALALVITAAGWLVLRKQHNDRCAGYSRDYYAALDVGVQHLARPGAIDAAFDQAKLVQDKARAAHCPVPDFAKDAGLK